MIILFFSFCLPMLFKISLMHLLLLQSTRKICTVVKEEINCINLGPFIIGCENIFRKHDYRVIVFFTFVLRYRYASLYFCCAIEDQDNELITLEIIHRYVELLDKYFGSVSSILFQEIECHSIFWNLFSNKFIIWLSWGF